MVSELMVVLPAKLETFVLKFVVGSGKNLRACLTNDMVLMSSLKSDLGAYGSRTRSLSIRFQNETALLPIMSRKLHKTL